MLSASDRTTADLYGITRRIEKFQAELLAVDGIVDVDFDLSGFLSDIPQVIFLPEYDIPVQLPDYYTKRRALLKEAVRIASENGMTRTDDRIEDYGTSFYIVTTLGAQYYHKRKAGCFYTVRSTDDLHGIGANIESYEKAVALLKAHIRCMQENGCSSSEKWMIVTVKWERIYDESGVFLSETAQRRAVAVYEDGNMVDM